MFFRKSLPVAGGDAPGVQACPRFHYLGDTPYEFTAALKGYNYAQRGLRTDGPLYKMEVPPPQRDSSTHGVRSSTEKSRICSWRVLRWLLVPALALLIIASSVYSVILVTKEKPKIIINETQYREGIVLDLQAVSSYSHIPDTPGVLELPTNNNLADTKPTKIEDHHKISQNETQNASSTSKSQSQEEDALLESLVGSFKPVSAGNNDQNGVKEFGVSVGESGYRQVPNSHQSGELLQQQVKMSKAFEKSTTVLPVSPTLPSLHQAKGSAETTQSPLNISNSDCFSPQLSMCRGVVPWDLTTLPSRRLLPGLQSSQELQDALPYFELVLESGCSPRTQDFLCSLLEPECRPEHMSTLPPCRNVCRAVAEDCGDFILDMLDLSKAFQCENYPDSDDPAICVNLARGRKCLKSEHSCGPSESCIPSKWRCNGVQDCKDGSDETNCTICNKHQFTCDSGDACVPLEWKCDGNTDCSDGSDEKDCSSQEDMIVMHSHASPCPAGELRCLDGRCITIQQICNGRQDCTDGADEANCRRTET